MRLSLRDLASKVWAYDGIRTYPSRPGPSKKRLQSLHDYEIAPTCNVLRISLVVLRIVINQVVFAGISTKGSFAAHVKFVVGDAEGHQASRL